MISRFISSSMGDFYKNIFLCFDEEPTANPQFAILLRKYLAWLGYNVFTFTGSSVDENDPMFKLYGISGDVSAKISNCMVVLFCVSREFKHNIRCKKVAQYARTKRDQSPRNQPEILFAMLQGNYTTQSYPYSVDGWLRHLIKDTLWYPAWNKPYIKGAGEAVSALISLKRRQIVVEPAEDYFSSVSRRSRSRSSSPNRSPHGRDASRARSASPGPSTSDVKILNEDSKQGEA